MNHDELNWLALFIVCFIGFFVLAMYERGKKYNKDFDERDMYN